jgi:hypothetical protein
VALFHPTAVNIQAEPELMSQASLSQLRLSPLHYVNARQVVMLALKRDVGLLQTFK